jgi:hypothetical protein
VTWIAGIIGIAALVRLLRGRRRAPAGHDADAGGPDPALELRSKLAETREQQPDEASAGNADPDPAADAGTLDERRARIHEKAQQAIDEMSADES